MPSSLNEVRSIEVAETIFKDIDNEISEWSKNDDTLFQEFKDFQNKVIEVLRISRKYTFKQMTLNGYHSLALLCLKFLLTLKKDKYFKSLKSLNKFKELLKVFIFHLNVLINFEKNKNETNLPDDKDDNHNNCMRLFADDFQLGFSIINQYHDNHIDQAKLHEAYPVFFCTKRSRFFYQSYVQLTAFSFHDFPKCFKTFFSPKLRAKTLVNLTNNSTIKSPGAIWDLLDINLMRKLESNVFYRHKDAVGENVTIATKTTWKPTGKDGDVIQVDEERHPIKVRIIRHRRIKNTNGVLMFHGHGSGFINTRPPMHDSYLKKWVANMNGVAAFCIDYSLKTRFDIQFQEMIDSYLWVTSGSPEVERIIGYKPESIIFVGDSAGAFLLMATLGVLTKIEAKSNLKLIYPKAFLAIYGAFNINGQFSPSKFMSSFDPIISYGTLWAMMGVLAGFQNTVEVKTYNPNTVSRVCKAIYKDIRAFGKALSLEKEVPWYKENNQISPEKLFSFSQALDTPYLNLLSMKFYDQLPPIKLFMLTTHFCPFLDDSTEMANLWKGPVEFHVVDRLLHGFLFLPLHNEERLFALKLIQEALKYAQSEVTKL